MCVEEVLIDTEQWEPEKVACPPGPPPVPVNESSPPTWLEIEGVVLPDSPPAPIDQSFYLLLPTSCPVNKPRSPANESPSSSRSEQEMSAVAGLLELAQATKCGSCVESLGENKSSGSPSRSGEIRVEIPSSLLRRLFLEDIKLTKTILETDIVLNLVESESNEPSEQRPIKMFRQGEAGLWSVADLKIELSSPEPLARKSADDTKIPKRRENKNHGLVEHLRRGKLQPRSLKDHDLFKFQSSAGIAKPKTLSAKDEDKRTLLATRKRDTLRLEPNIQSKKVIKPRKIGLKSKATSVAEQSAVHVPQKFLCSICPRKYANSSNLSRHQQVHRNPNSQDAMSCDICKKSYLSKPAFVMHMQTHCKVFNCTLCSKSFSRKWSLEGHIRSHTGEKPFACYHCKRTFSDKSNMQAHAMIHQRDKRLSCPVCEKVFWVLPYFKRHLKRVHDISGAELFNRNN